VDLFERLHAVRERNDVLRHSFYVRWSRGELSRDELAFYAGEYRHAVAALADAARAAAEACEPGVRAQLSLHASEEEGHIDLWDDFAAAVEAEADTVPTAETRECVNAWTDGADDLEHLVTLYAIESAQPAISRTKLDGLVAHYGITTDDRGAAYFAVHADRDHEHAAEVRELIEERATEEDADRLIARAETALRGNWTLLDGVERRFER
jgi:pyrroloquinoline-quinone synthase